MPALQDKARYISIVFDSKRHFHEELGTIIQNVLCEKLRILPRGKPIAGEMRAMGSFDESMREAKRGIQRATEAILSGDLRN